MFLYVTTCYVQHLSTSSLIVFWAPWTSNPSCPWQNQAHMLRVDWPWSTVCTRSSFSSSTGCLQTHRTWAERPAPKSAGGLAQRPAVSSYLQGTSTGHRGKVEWTGWMRCDVQRKKWLSPFESCICRKPQMSISLYIYICIYRYR